jgi:hypothetical protein
MVAAIPAMDGSEGPTQLDEILECMLRAAIRGEWLTLDEIAGTTEFGEASVSAQLRHLRKPRHGLYRVEKRRRRFGESEAGRHTKLWEYQVSPPLQALLRFAAVRTQGKSRYTDVQTASQVETTREVESAGEEVRDAKARS